MSLLAGTCIGPYQILSALGAGGMGEVYRARDSKLNRDVAIKVLLPAVANDPDRLARFSREAQVLASLNHPNIAHIHGLEESNGVTALVMELVEGEDLSQRISRGAIPLDEALPIARQIAEALEAAHDHGIVHRDLKPANIKVRPDGTVKVLDFGLAKAFDPTAGSSATAMNSPTLSIHATEAGVILGTAAYMSPEQAAGKTVDKRSDLWAFGVVLMEMLTGRQVFKGETVSHRIASVLKDSPDWSELPSSTPPPIHRLLRRCLEKDRKRRLPDAAVARLEIDDASAPGETSRRRAPWSRWSAAVVLAVLAVAASFAAGRWWLTGDAPVVSAEVVRFAIHDTSDVTVSRVDDRMALSPDGRTLAFVGYGERGSGIWLRALDALDARPLKGTDGAGAMAWFPDSRTLAFVVREQLMKVAVPDGTPEKVGQTVGTGIATLAVDSDGRLLVGDGLRLGTLPAAGGTPTWLPRASEDDAHRSPAFLPGGRHYLYRVLSTDSSRTGTFVTGRDGGDPVRLLPFPSAARYANGHLIFVRDRVLYAQRLDAASLELSGDPAALSGSTVGSFAASDRGTVVYLPVSDDAASEAGQLQWMDRAGRVLGRIEQSTGATSPALSPDGRQLAMVLRGDLWVYNLARGVLARLTSNARGMNLSAGSPTWLPDSRRVIFFRNAFKNGHDVLIETEVGATDQETILRESGGRHAHPTDLSADGQYLIYEGESDSQDIWALRLTGDRQAQAYVKTPSSERQGAISPDGRWLAYTADSSGRFEIYVQSFPESGVRIQVSPNGGKSARWSRDGTELFYIASDGKVMATPVRFGRPIEFGASVALFRFVDPQQLPSQRPNYDVTADGQRFIVSSIERRTDPSMHVLLNWPALLERP
jgi:Tol biopolymer transport system component